MFDNLESVLAVVVAILIAYAIVLWVGIVVWTYRDMRERTRDGWSQAVAVAMVAVFSIPGFFLYLILRPHETLTEAYERRLEAEALMRELPARTSCPRCERAVDEDFLLCPHCRTTLREPCLGCGRGLELTWTACPYCGAQGPQAVVQAAQVSEPPAVAAPQEQRLEEPKAAQQPAAQPGPTGQPPR